jgi:peroxiredoxin
MSPQFSHGPAATLWAAVALTCLTLLAHGPAGAAARAGAQAPTFRLEGFDGSTVTLARFAGRPLYINVFASWCPPWRGPVPPRGAGPHPHGCRAGSPLIGAPQQRFGGRVAFLAVSTQEAAAPARRFASEMHATFPVAIDRGRMGIAYGAVSLPDSFFIDRHGVVRAVVHGPVDRVTLERDLTEIAG